MNKGDIVSAIATKAGFTLKDADEAYKAFVSSVAEALKNGEEVVLAGFGTFKVKERAERTGVNPQTKKAIKIPATKAPTFKFGKSFKELLK